MTLYLKAAAYLIVLAIGFSSGFKVATWRKDAQILAMQEQAQVNREKALVNIRLLEEEQEAREQVAAQLDVERQRKAKVIEKVITNDVIKYVQKPASQSCGIDSDGVRIINTAASGRLSEATFATSEPDASPSGATAAQVVASVTDNYSTCHANTNQLIALQDWVRSHERQ